MLQRFRFVWMTAALLLTLFAPQVHGDVRTYFWRVFDTSADPNAPIPNYFVADFELELGFLTSAVAGDVGFALDENALFTYNGSAWVGVTPADLSGENYVTWAVATGLSNDRVMTAGKNTTVNTATASQIKIDVTAAGSDGQIQYNNSGVLGGDSSLVWNDTSDILGVAGHMVSGIAGSSGDDPALSACGSSPSFTVGDDKAGRFTVGTGISTTSCTLTFDTAYSVAPACFANNESAIVHVRATPSTTAVVFTTIASMSSNVIAYWCIGPQ